MSYALIVIGQEGFVKKERGKKSEKGGESPKDRAIASQRSENAQRPTSNGRGRGYLCWKPIWGLVGVVSGGGLRIFISSCRTSKIATSCASRRLVSCFSSCLSFFANSRVPDNAERI